METRLLKKYNLFIESFFIYLKNFQIYRFPPGALVNIENDYWKLIRIGLESVGIG